MTLKPPIGHYEIIRVEVFDWTAPEGDVTIQFNITSMLADIYSRKLDFAPITTAIDRDWLAEWMPLREPNETYARSIPPKRRAEPVLGVWMPDETVLLIDGTHRYLSRAMWSYRTIDWFVVRDPAWRSYAVINGPLAQPKECPL